MVAYIHKLTKVIKHAPEGSIRHDAFETSKEWSPATDRQVEQDIKRRRQEEEADGESPDQAG